MTMEKYTEIFNKMQPGVQYTASQLGVAGATMTAMVRRDMVKDCGGKPKHYVKVNSKLGQIKAFYDEWYDKVALGTTEYITLWKKNQPIGMMCYWKDGTLYDCYGKLYGSVQDVCAVQVGHYKGEIKEED